jgi:peptidoglycan hydrolase-like amidase
VRSRFPAALPGTLVLLLIFNGLVGRATAAPPAPIPVANPVVEASTVPPPAPEPNGSSPTTFPATTSPAATAPAATIPPTTKAPRLSMRITGHGFGHGRGLGQWGAFGYATKIGWRYTRILEHFYGNTVPGKVAPESSLGVRLTAFDNRPIVVYQQRGWVFTQIAGQAIIPPGGPTTTTTTTTTTAPPLPVGAVVGVVAQPNAPSTAPPAPPTAPPTSSTVVPLPNGPAAVKVQLTSAGWVLSDGPGCSGPWRPRPGVVAPNVLITTGPQQLPGEGDPTKLLQLCTTDGREVYRGDILAADGKSDGKAGQYTVNQLGLEDYLRGVIPREIPAGWGDKPNGMEALKAQTVAARSYASAERRTGFSNTCDTTACQVYRGRGKFKGEVFESNEDPRTDRAVVETAGEVRVEPTTGTPIRTEFSASTGGHTAPGEFPAVVDDGDDLPANPHRTWTFVVSAPKLEVAAKGLGPFTGAQVVEADGQGISGGRALRVRLSFAKGFQELTGAEMTKRFGLRSNYFSIDVLSDASVLDSGSGAVVAAGAGDPVDAVLGVPGTPDSAAPNVAPNVATTSAAKSAPTPSSVPKREPTATVVVSPSATRTPVVVASSVVVASTVATTVTKPRR